MEEIIKKADVLIEALPYIQSFYDKTIVIKFGGAGMTDPVIRRNVLEDIVFMSYVGMRPVLVHGGGPYINKRLEEIGKEIKFVKGFRVTDEETMEIVEEELEKVNREIVREIISHGGSAISLSGKEDHLIEVKKLEADGTDIGYVGEITKINGDVIQKMLISDIIPVISPIGIGKDGFTYNVNADQSAAEIARSLSANKLILLTNVRGVLGDPDDPGSFISHITVPEIEKLVGSKVISAGMIPKVKACMRALERGVKKIHIIDSKIPHGILLEIFTDKGIGTEIVKR
ncbi:MAG: acetylglutamate kinase [Omnitrophica bacterium RIFCSPHIGHO2_02_FULL_51_18]|nr:MAG: acetylglutamate kinase [Omnitrophica bacterium RIFCSPHIGHO2_02_FULL_51_18]